MICVFSPTYSLRCLNYYLIGSILQYLKEFVCSSSLLGNFCLMFYTNNRVPGHLVACTPIQQSQLRQISGKIAV